MDGAQSQIKVDMTTALPSSIGREVPAQPNARELSLTAKNRSLASENTQLENRNNQLRSENQSLKLDMRSLEQEMRARETAPPSIPGYATGNSVGQMIDDYF
jgi:cell division protein FtsB